MTSTWTKLENLYVFIDIYIYILSFGLPEYANDLVEIWIVEYWGNQKGIVIFESKLQSYFDPPFSFFVIN